MRLCGSTKFRAARALDERLRELTRRERRAEADLAGALLEMADTKLHRMLGFPSLGDYAEVRLEMPAGKARQLVELARRLKELPALERTFRDGDLSWTKCRQVARVATKETEQAWIGRAKATTNRELEDEVAREKGETPKVRLVLELTREQAADIEDGVRHLREACGPGLGLGAAIAMLVRQAAAPPVDRPGHQVVIHECPTCKSASRDAAGGPVAVGPEALAEAKADAEVLDLRGGGTGTRSVTIPPAVRRAVIARDHGRCVICGNRKWLHVHHLDRRSQGGSSHDPDGLCILCSTCHKKLVHGGFVRLEGRGGALEAVLHDGTRLPAGGGRPPALRAQPTPGDAPARRVVPAYLRELVGATHREIGDESLLAALGERPALAG